MSGHVTWMLELDVHPGSADAFRKLAAEMVVATQTNEQRTLVYEWSISADEKTAHLLETYADSDAGLVHVGNFAAHYMERFLQVVTPTRLTVYGSPSDDLRDALAPFKPTYMARLDGFVR